MTVVDAHLHVWDLERASYPWLGPHLAPIDRTVSLDEIEPELRAHDVGAVILVQAADAAADTAHMLAVADAHRLVRGIVAWVPLDDAVATEAALAGADERIVGVRTLIHDRPDPDWILRPEVDAGLGVVASAGIPYDYVTSSPDALAHLPAIGARHPHLALVVDHLGKPPLDGDPARFAAWETLLRRAAENPRLSAKVSGLYGPPAGVRAVVEVALDAFGPHRLMYGSDWPISVVSGGAAAAWDALAAALAHLDDADRAAVYDGTARRVYALPEETP